MTHKVIVLVGLLLMLAMAPGVVAQSPPINVQCGDIVQGELLPSEDQRIFQDYTLQVRAGTVIDLIVEPLGQNFNVGFALRDAAGTDLETYNRSGAGSPEQLLDYTVGGSNQIIGIYGVDPTYSTDFLEGYFYTTANAGEYLGAYRISLACSIDGVRIEFGESVEETEGGSSVVAPPPFTGFGFPGIPPTDFTAGIEIPLTVGQAQTAPIGEGIVALYTYDATAGANATLNVTRVSGNISVGVTVINRDSNEIVFVGGMPHSDTLTAALTFPADGTYVVGLFRLDTPTLTGTSGAVQVSIE